MEGGAVPFTQEGKNSSLGYMKGIPFTVEGKNHA
jgi:hypothetical protein